MAQIMAVTGHKSASSVAVYQRVSSKEKQEEYLFCSYNRFEFKNSI
jgi:hypothetical protein